MQANWLRGVLYVAIATAALGNSSGFADHGCDSINSGLAIDKRASKYVSGYIDFIAESYVQKFTETSRQFIWCIRNIHPYHVAEFRWGTLADEEKYFSALVEPNKEAETFRTDSSEARFDGRVVKFRRLNSSAWKEMVTETIFFDRIGKAPTRVRVAQATTSPDPFEAVDLEKLSEEPGRLDRFMNQRSYFKISNGITATIPATSEAKEAIERRTYEVYDQRDFARVTVLLLNYLASEGGTTLSRVTLELFAIDRRADDAVKRVRYAVRISSSDPRATSLLGNMSWEMPIEASNQTRELVNVRVDKLALIDVLVSLVAVDTGFVLARMPVKILLPIRR